MSAEELTRKRASVKSRLTSFQSFVKKLETDASKVRELPLRLERAEGLLAEFEAIQYEIEAISNFDIKERTKFEDTYYTIITSARESITQLNPRFTSGASTSVVTSNAMIHTNSLLKLPNINLPTFEGEYDKWITFRDTFEAIIDSNANLTRIQKFYYLQSAVKGSVAQCFQSLSLSNENYDAAWRLLKSRFENKRLIVHHHIQALFDLPIISKESCVNLRKLIDDVQQHLCALTKLEQPVQTWDTLLIHLITPKLDPKTKREWEFKRDLTTLPTMTEFIDFLNKRCSILETLLSSNKLKDIAMSDAKSQRKSVALTTQALADKTCPSCKNRHWLYACPAFQKLTTQERLREAKRLKVCLNCLRSHADRECTFGGCQRCKRRHNTMLHFDTSEHSAEKTHNEKTNSSSKETVAESSAKSDVNITMSHCATKGIIHALLSTAVILIRDSNGKYRKCRALLDSASQSHFMTNNLCQQLQLKMYKIDHLINGIGQTNVFVNHKTTAIIRSRYNDYQAELPCFVVDSISGMLPSDKLDTRQIIIPKHVLLADPEYNIPSKVDLLIGVTLFYDLLRTRRIVLGNNQPILQETTLGWIIGGHFAPCKASTQLNVSQCSLSLNAQTQKQLERFWKLKEIETTISRTKEEQFCEEQFASTYQGDEHGRFVVRLPLKNSVSTLGRSQEIAERRLYAIERKLQKNEDLRKAYMDFIQEYEILGHMSQVKESIKEIETANYLPHHAVIKSRSTTTKVRVVFDASCKTSSGKSLNDILCVGPTIQDSLFSILLRFRQHKS